MTATDELRKMLDERGIEYTTLSYSDATWWTDTNGLDWCYEENCVSTQLTCCSFRITPAQAIAATLGPKVCHMSYNELSNTSICLACGWRMDGKPNYCPNCGAKVVEE